MRTLVAGAGVGTAAAAAAHNVCVLFVHRIESRMRAFPCATKRV